MGCIGIAVNKPKDPDFTYTRKVVECVLNNGFEAIVTPDIANDLMLGTVVSEGELFQRSDFVICLGGDGTFLKTARSSFGTGKPILGINLGSVGFLAEVEKTDIERAVWRLTNGQANISERMVLSTEVLRNNEVVFQDFALNDAVVSRKTISRVINVLVDADGHMVDTFTGDGLIVATPTGSTAYTLSAGGPIVRPDMSLMVLTPICPHILYSRSFVLPSNNTVSIRILDDRMAEGMLTVDGQNSFELKQHDVVQVKQAIQPILFASVCNVNFYDVLRAKIRGRNHIQAVSQGEDI